MTEFKNVTHEILNINNVLMNLTVDKMWINPDIGNWYDTISQLGTIFEEDETCPFLTLGVGGPKGNDLEYWEITFLNHSNDIGVSIVSPLKAIDKDKFSTTRHRNNPNKSVKPVLPKTIIEMAKEILIEDDYAFSRSFKHQEYQFENDEHDRRFNPVATIALFTLLSIPIRGIQVCLLDSGEADELIISENGEQIKNSHSLAQNGRSQGCFRRYTDASTATSFTGFFINTNKTKLTMEEIGYEIPYNDQKLIKHLMFLRYW